MKLYCVLETWAAETLIEKQRVFDYVVMATSPEDAITIMKKANPGHKWGVWEAMELDQPYINLGGRFV